VAARRAAGFGMHKEPGGPYDPTVPLHPTNVCTVHDVENTVSKSLFILSRRTRTLGAFTSPAAKASA